MFLHLMISASLVYTFSTILELVTFSLFSIHVVFCHYAVRSVLQLLNSILCLVYYFILQIRGHSQLDKDLPISFLDLSGIVMRLQLP